MKPWPCTPCARVQRVASAFLDGRLSAAARAVVQQHLNACSVCLHELQRLARLSRAMHNLPPFRIAGGMAVRLRRQLAAARLEALPLAATPVTPWSPPRAKVARRVAAIASAAAAAAIAVFWLGYTRGRATVTAPAEAPIANRQAATPNRSPTPAPTPSPTPAEGRRVAREPAGLVEREARPLAAPQPPPTSGPPPTSARFAGFDPERAGHDVDLEQAPPPSDLPDAQVLMQQLVQQMLNELFDGIDRRQPPRR